MYYSRSNLYEVVKMAAAKKRISEPEIVSSGKKFSAGPAFISIIILLAAVLVGIVATTARKAGLANNSVASTVSTNNITITDPTTKKSFSIEVKPASASMSVQQGAQNTGSVKIDKTVSKVPSAAVINSSPKQAGDFSYLFKEAESKTAIQKISLDEAKWLFNNHKAIFIDARGKNEYDERHIFGAYSIPAGDTAASISRTAGVLKDKGKVIVSYCHGVGCHLSDKTAYALYDAGYKNVLIFFGGWNTWTDAKYPVEGKK
jgi:rhodanese-related sulfurtransferase